MSEAQGHTEGATGGESAGALMRRAREQAGLHIAALAVSLKVPVKRLEALEADRHDLLPGPVFTRALASSVCRALKLDAVQVLALLPQVQRQELVVAGALNQPFRGSGPSGTSKVWPQLSRPALWGGAALLLAAAIVYFLPEFASFKPGSQTRSDAGAGAVVTESVSPAGQAVDRTAAVSPVPAASASADAVRRETGLSAASAAPAVSAPAGVLADATTVLAIQAQSPAWVEVLDSAGLIVLRRVLNSGEMAPISASTPLRVTVGNAGDVRVRVRGQPFDLVPLTQNNVARFEVK